MKLTVSRMTVRMDTRIVGEGREDNAGFLVVFEFKMLV